MEMEEDLKQEKYVAIDAASADLSGCFNQNKVQYEETLMMDLQKYYHEDLPQKSEQQFQINSQTDNESDSHIDLRHLDKNVEKIAKGISDDDLKCAICFRFMQSPKLLPCLHSLCLVCLKTLCYTFEDEEHKNVVNVDGSFLFSENDCSVKPEYEIRKRDNSLSESLSSAAHYPEVSVKKYSLTKPIGNPQSVTVECPICKEKCDVPLRGIDEFVTNIMLENKVKTKEKLTQKAQCEICKLRNIVEDAVAFCVDCTDMLCKSCWQSHSFTRFTMTHKIVPLEEIEDIINGEGVSKWSSIKCESHNTEVLKYVCTECNHLLCRECLVLEHLGHSCILSSNAADAKRMDLKFLIYGLKERLDHLRKNEHEEYLVQMNRITTAEETELQKINNVCDSLIAAIEKERQNVLEKMKSEFKKMSEHCKYRYGLFQNIETKMNSAIYFVKLLESKSNNEEFLLVEPVVHDRLVKLVNMTVEPCPVSLYTLPKTDCLNPITITCSVDQDIDLANTLFETKESGRPERRPNILELNEVSMLALEDLLKAGRFTRLPCSISYERKSARSGNYNMQDTYTPTAWKSNFVDATIWPHSGSSKSEYEFRNSFNGRPVVLGSSCSSSSDSQADDVFVEHVKGKNDKKGGGNKKCKKELVDTQNVLTKTSSQQFFTVTPASFSLPGNSNLLTIRKTDNRTQIEHSSMSANFGNIEVFNPDNVIAEGSPYSFSNNNLSNQIVQHGDDKLENMDNKIISLPNKTKNISQTLTMDNPLNQPVSASDTAFTTTLSLQLKRKLDVKLDTDKYEPILTGVYCYRQVEIVVSDIRNSKVKIFCTTGQLLRHLEVKNVGRAILTSNMLIYSSQNTVRARKDDQNVLNTIKYKNESECVVTWFLKGNILVGNRNKIHEYTIDQHQANFVKTNEIAIEGGSVERIVDIRCDINGHKVVVVDSNRKSVVILNINGQTLGTYEETENSVWNPTSACFDKRGNVFVVDGGGNRLVLLNQQGKYIEEWSKSLNINRPTFVTTFNTQPLYLAGHGRYINVFDYAYI